MSTFGENLKACRKRVKMKQEDLAEQLGTTQQHVSAWEHNVNEPSLTSIIRIIRILDTTFESLTEGIFEEQGL